MRQSLVAAATLAMAGGAAAAQSSSIGKTCPLASSGICYELNIPDATASSGTGDIFFSVTAPMGKYQWFALGQGNEMPNSNIFVMYASADGKNVTVSTRPSAGTGHNEPQYSADGAQIKVLAGSGISNGIITANVRCSNCHSWNGGTMDFSSDSGSWIHAEKFGTPIMSDDLMEDIVMHDERGVFTWQFASAKGGSDANPFVASDRSTTDTSGSTMSQDSDDDSSSSMSENILIAHGVVGALAFIVFFPTGAILIRLASFPGLVWVHAGIQLLGWALYICAFGLGLWMAFQNGQTSEYHPIVGYVLFALLIFQPLGGLLHHLGFKKTGTRTMWSFGHIFIGRIAIILGMIQGGLGLMLADDSSTGERIAYGVIAGVVGVAYITAIVIGETKRSKRAKASPQEMKEERDGSQ